MHVNKKNADLRTSSQLVGIGGTSYSGDHISRQKMYVYYECWIRGDFKLADISHIGKRAKIRSTRNLTERGMDPPPHTFSVTLHLFWLKRYCFQRICELSWTLATERLISISGEFIYCSDLSMWRQDWAKRR